MADLLTDKLVRECNNFVRGYFASRRKCGQVPVSDDQLRQINEIEPQRDQATTCRIELDVDRLKEAASEAMEDVSVTVQRHLLILCKDLEHHISELTHRGERLVFTAPVQVYMWQEAFKFRTFLWMDYVQVQPQEPPSCLVPITPPTASPA